MRTTWLRSTSKQGRRRIATRMYDTQCRALPCHVVQMVVRSDEPACDACGNACVCGTLLLVAAQKLRLAAAAAHKVRRSSQVHTALAVQAMQAAAGVGDDDEDSDAPVRADPLTTPIAATTAAATAAVVTTGSCTLPSSGVDRLPRHTSTQPSRGAGDDSSDTDESQVGVTKEEEDIVDDEELELQGDDRQQYTLADDFVLEKTPTLVGAPMTVAVLEPVNPKVKGDAERIAVRRRDCAQQHWRTCSPLATTSTRTVTHADCGELRGGHTLVAWLSVPG